MRNPVIRCALLLLVVLLAVPAPAQEILTVTSPLGKNLISFSLQDGIPMYQVDRGETPVIKPSRMGFTLKQVELNGGFELVESESGTVDDTWVLPWGEVDTIRDFHNWMNVTLQTVGDDPWRLKVYFRAYDDGVAFRYEILPREGVGEVQIMDELTEFALAGDHSAWWIGGYQGNRYEYLYQNTAVSELDTVHTPVTMETAGGLYLSFHEAALTDYASMVLVRNEGLTLDASLAEWSDGVKVRGELPIKSPWRTIQIADTPGGLITSYLILNCNEPSKIEDTSWIKPAKYVGIWWEMHLATSTWESGDKHGATTENTKRYIDFAAANGFDAVLVEGWNIGWDGNWVANGELFSFTEPYPDYDLTALAEYAKEKGVYIIAHNETSTGILNYEQQMDAAFTLYEKLGMKAIKSGYVGHGKEILRKDPATSEVLGKEWHHGQWMVNHYRRVVETAAKHHIMLDVHEPIKPTGIRRTWPNMMTREGARGQEYNAWAGDGGNPPEHVCVLPFTRLLAGPMDFTPGIFDLLYQNNPDARPNNRVNTTLAKQLAEYVVIYSPMQMAADLPENYEGHPAFQFIRDVPVDWSETVVLNGEIGEFVTIARKDRNSEDWYLGSVTNEKARTLAIPLDFLSNGITYTAQIYADGADADWVTNPYSYEIGEQKVFPGDIFDIRLAPGGGQAVRFIAEED